MKLNRHAYTLSEFILVIVLVALLGFLVFLRVSHRVATEQAQAVENFLQEVRTEQQDRCFDNLKYAQSTAQLKIFEKADKQFVYDLSDGEGIVARHSLYGYRLRMPSYEDGRLCCDDCEQLNRRYSPCARLTARADFKPADPECVPAQSDVKNPRPAKKHKSKRPARKQPGKNTSKPQISKEDTLVKEPENQTPDVQVPSEQPQTSPEPVQPSTQTVSAPAETENNVPSSQPETKETCLPPAEHGSYYIEPCDTFSTGAQGSVVFTWNEQSCSYDAAQSCVIPSRWKSIKSITKEEKEVYPSDLDELCEQALAKNRCPQGAARDKACFSVGDICYSRCEISDKKSVQEFSNIVLYDVTLSIQRLECNSPQNATVKIPQR